MRYLLVILFALFSITGTSQIFETQFEKGSYIDRISRIAGTPTDAPFLKLEKGLCVDFNGSSSVVSWNNSQNLTSIILEFWNKNEVLFTSPLNSIGSFGGTAGLVGFGPVSGSFSTETFSWFQDATTDGGYIKANIPRGWNQIIMAWNETQYDVFLNNISVTVFEGGGASPEMFNGNIFLGKRENFATYYIGKIKGFGGYSHTLSAKERTKSYNEFLQATALSIEKHPKYGPWNKPTSLNDPGLVATYNMIPSAGGVLTDISGNGINGTISGAISSVDGMVFDGTNDNVVLGNVGNIKSISFRIKPESTTEKILEGAANDKLIHINAGTLTYPDYDDAYVDGVNTNTMVADQWQNVTVVSSTDVDNTALTFALNNATYGAFEIEDLKFYSTEFIEQQAQDYHNSFAKRVVLVDNFEYDAVGSVPLGWQIESGTFAIAEDVTSKYISCTGNGNIVFHGVDLSVYFESGWIKTLTGDLSGDQDDTVDNATNLAYSNGKLNVTMTSGQKLRELIITQAEEQ